MWIHVDVGEYKCGSYLPCDGDPDPGPPRTCATKACDSCAKKDCKNDGNAPPVKIMVDFGDGSGESVWQRENVQDVWSHIYSEPGIYTIFVMST